MIRADKLKQRIDECDKGDNLEVKVIMRSTKNSVENDGDIIVERIKTPDYVLITKLYVPMSKSKL